MKQQVNNNETEKAKKDNEAKDSDDDIPMELNPVSFHPIKKAKAARG